MSESSYCKYCGKQLLWVTTNSGARMPLDKDTSEQRWVTNAADNPMTATLRRTYTSHMDTCKKERKVGDGTNERGGVRNPRATGKLFGD